MQAIRETSVWRDVNRENFWNAIVPEYRPAILRGLVGDWPAVAAARGSHRGMRDYLAQMDTGAPVEAFVGAPARGGRFFYDETLRGFNFEKKRAKLTSVLDRLLTLAGDANASATYAGAIPTAEHLPAFASDNAIALVGKEATQRLWVGNATVVSTHYDVADNIACVVAGQRRFTFFPPDQVGNLYVGPLEHTMAGRPVSMVDLDAPDHERYPRFADALAAAEVAELEPGDAVYIPSLWWHHVEARGPLNVLVNYWWNAGPDHAGSPFECLVHGLLAIRDLPEPQREAWRAIFDHYLFGRNGDPAAHLPPGARGVLGPPSPARSRSMKAFLMRSLAEA